jgi:hypothetical protein
MKLLQLMQAPLGTGRVDSVGSFAIYFKAVPHKVWVYVVPFTVSIHHDNAPTHFALSMQEFLAKMAWLLFCTALTP